MKMTEYRILVKGELIPADVSTWCQWFENLDNRRIDFTKVGDVQISTVCLGLNHGTFKEPLWFETMVFGGEHDGVTERYPTLETAQLGHKQMVARESR
jgi:hypothetical protein